MTLPDSFDTDARRPAAIPDLPAHPAGPPAADPQRSSSPRSPGTPRPVAPQAGTPVEAAGDDEPELVSAEGPSTPRPDSPPEPHARAGRRVRLDEAERELDRLERRAIAALLRQATALAVRRSPFHGVFSAFPLPVHSIRLWRRRATAVLRSIERDRSAAVEGAELVARLIRRPIRGWPTAARLALAARRVEDSEFARVCLGYALICDGHAEHASRLFSRLLRRADVLRHRWRVLEGLGLAHQALGRYPLALGAMESAADDPRAGVSTLVEGLQLALVVGDARRARRAAARIDMLTDPFSPAFAAALGRVRTRARVVGLPPVAPDGAVAVLLAELVREQRSPAGRVARVLT